MNHVEIASPLNEIDISLKNSIQLILNRKKSNYIYLLFIKKICGIYNE